MKRTAKDMGHIIDIETLMPFGKEEKVIEVSRRFFIPHEITCPLDPNVKMTYNEGAKIYETSQLGGVIISAEQYVYYKVNDLELEVVRGCEKE